ncbi:MAG: hypothetical protein IJJ41_08685 [Clostridia bacterium]|nr:hypothetical protein [Clostridia bacterium]
MRKQYVLAVIVLAAMMLSSCSTAKHSSLSNETTLNASTQATQENQPTAQRSNKMKITVNGEAFSVTLEDNDTARAFTEMLPQTLEMSELHGNEKYHYLDTALPDNPQSVSKIQEGDILLYGDNCIVIFYKCFDTEYAYTKIGHIDNTASLEKQLGNGKIEVSFDL